MTLVEIAHLNGKTQFIVIYARMTIKSTIFAPVLPNLYFFPAVKGGVFSFWGAAPPATFQPPAPCRPPAGHPPPPKAVAPPPQADGGGGQASRRASLRRRRLRRHGAGGFHYAGGAAVLSVRLFVGLYICKYVNKIMIYRCNR